MELNFSTFYNDMPRKKEQVTTGSKSQRWNESAENLRPERQNKWIVFSAVFTNLTQPNLT